MSKIQELGKSGENLAATYYERNNFHLITKNFQFYRQGTRGRQGEIDLIFCKDELLVLVEVKTRSNDLYGSPEEQITKYKLRKLYNTFQYFLKRYPRFNNNSCRFDVACVQNDRLKIIKNAYSFEGVINS